ncbi:MAG: lantibiotic immunity ABC transporter MutG family permease subunit [Cellulosilyticaceae bacterium]
MGTFYRLLKAECLKMKRTPFYKLHVIAPIIGVILFLTYYGFTNWNEVSKVQGYIEVLSIVFPLLGALVTTMLIETEAEAGAFKEVLCTKYSRNKIFCSKLCFLLLAATCATLVAVGGFFLGFYYILGETKMGGLFYVKLALIILFSQVGLYCWHMILCFKTGKGITLGVGIVETLLAAILQTGLGDGIWQLIPCSFGARLSDYYLKSYLQGTPLYLEIKMESIVVIVITVGMIVFSLKTFYDYEGRKGIEG